MELYDLRLISECGADPEWINAVNETVGPMDEAFEAHQQSMKIRKSEDVKHVKELIKEGNKLVKTDIDAASKKYDEAIKILTKMGKEIDNIDNDDMFSGIVLSILHILKQALINLPLAMLQEMLFDGRSVTVWEIPNPRRISRTQDIKLYNKLIDNLKAGQLKLKKQEKKNEKAAKKGEK